ncbi:MAG: hypothetical protein ACOC6C_06180 [Verrucomicrobiota bacterium]
MTNAEKILTALDEELTSRIDLTLYGRAALHLGFPQSPKEHELSRDVDAVFWMGQAEELNENTNFWTAVEEINKQLADHELYISHFFTEDQVILRPSWRCERVRLPGEWKSLDLYRLADIDLLLSKLMRDDPLDRWDALFIVSAANLTIFEIEDAIANARVPDSAEVKEEFELASRKLLDELKR